MTLCVSGKHGLDQPEEWVTDKFSPILNKDVVIPSFLEPAAFPKDYLGKIIRYVPIKDEDRLCILFVLGYFGSDISSKPIEYFQHLQGHEGENSMLSYLKHKDWATQVSCDYSHDL